MKRLIMTTAICLTVGLAAQAQSETQDQGESFGERFNRLLKQTKTEMERAANSLGDAIGFEDRVHPEAGSVEASQAAPSGQHLSPDTPNAYTQADAEKLRARCRTKFQQKYPKAVIERVIIPQKDWKTETLKQNGQVKGYVKTLECYVMAKDGNEGYIHARYVYEQRKAIGKDFSPVSGRWPLAAGVDVIPMGE